MKEFKYYKFIKKTESHFTFNKIYVLQNSLKDFESFGSFIDDTGKQNGYGGTNHTHFIPATEEEYFIQEGIIIPVFNYTKLINILNFINNYEKTI